MFSTGDHKPVLLNAVVAYLRPQAGGKYVDGTIGGGGHAAAILEASGPSGRLLGLDVDEEAAQRARDILAPFGQRALVVNASYTELAGLAQENGFEPADGVLLDLGLSSYQLNDAARGFSFQREAPLDMRFDQRQATTAAGLLATLGEQELADIFYLYGEERRSRALARAVVAERRRRPITTTTEFASLVARVVHGRPGGIHPATRAFQALRIAVNGELANVESVLPQALEILRPGGRLAVIAFHSLEDRLVKRFFQREAAGCLCPPELPQCVCGHQPRLAILTKKPVVASAEEAAENPRSRSAKLRVAERLAVAA
ncbi:MAG: 16S rRNA (cytosine(1402)-N(4))-methyltransferase RsmH [Chloroflexi bacterium]|nr:16S rRNA (cytosine(1402)-N(4))-methyltransferase RsmH [Chloroflexota bacterium]